MHRVGEAADDQGQFLVPERRMANRFVRMSSVSSTRVRIGRLLEVQQQEPGVEMAVAVHQLARRLIVAGSLIAVVPSVVIFAGRSDAPAPRIVADDCTGLVSVNAVPACIPGLSGGSASAGAPSEGLITAKNWCNLVIGGCSSAFFYPPWPARRPNVDTSVRHSP